VKIVDSLTAIVLSGIFINNFILVRFLGLCPFFGVSKETKSALGMSAAVIFVMVLSTVATWIVYTYVLTPLSITFLVTISFILIIATLVQFVEFVIRKYSPPLYRALGIYLPLITTNCAVLGSTLLNIKESYSFAQSIVFSTSSGIGFGMMLLIMSGIREKLELSDVPESMKGVPIAFIIAGILSIVFMKYFGRIAL